MRNWFAITNDAERVTIDIYGAIGKSWFDDDAVSAKELIDAIRDANGRPIDLHVNSEGGSVFDAFAMFTALRDYDAPVTAYVDGLAASAASYIIAAADEVVMSDVAWVMIHEASGMVWGNKRELAKEIEVLDNIDQTIAGIYAKRSGQPVELFAQLMEEETWLDAESARGYGLVDTISEALPKVARASYAAQLMSNAPEAALAALVAASNQAETSDGDTSGEMQNAPENNDTTEQEQGRETAQERAFVVLDGRIYQTN